MPYDFNAAVQPPNNPLNQLAQLYQLRALKQNSEAEKQRMEMNALALEQAKRQGANQNALAAAYAKGVQPGQTSNVDLGQMSLGGQNLGSLGTSQVQGPVTVDRNVVLNELAKSQPGAVPDAQAHFAQMDFQHQQNMLQLREAAAKLTTEQRNAALKGLQVSSQIAAPLAQAEASNAPPEVLNSEYQRALQTAQANGIDVSQFPPQYVPGIGTKIMQQGLEAKDALTTQETKRAHLAEEQNRAATLDETKRNNQVQNSISQQNANTASKNASVNEQIKNLTAQKTQMEVDQSKRAISKTVRDIDNAIATVDRVGAHKGLSSVVGAKNVFGGDLGYATIPGTRAADFKAELGNLKSQTFLQSVQAMRGTGPLSDREGAKVESALANLDESQSEESFRAALVRVKQAFQGLKQAFTQESQTPQSGGGAVFARDPQGVLHQAPAGTPLPDGWIQENR